MFVIKMELDDPRFTHISELKPWVKLVLQEFRPQE